MSGRTKRILYYVADAVLFAVFGIGMALIVVFVPPRAELPRGNAEFWQYLLALAVMVAGLPVLLHECGHLLFGALAGMKPARFGFHPFSRGSVAGETAMYPKNGKHVKGKFFALTLGGAVVNVTVGAALFLLWLLLPAHPVGSGALSGFVFYEGVRALIPCELPAGKTDGAVLLGLLKRRPEEDVALRVLTAQGILYKGKYSDLPKELLFGAPVVREDLPAHHALLLLQAQYLLAAGEEEGAKEKLLRLSEAEGLTGEEEEEGRRYLQYFEGKFEAGSSPFSGVNALERVLAEKSKTAPNGSEPTFSE